MICSDERIRISSLFTQCHAFIRSSNDVSLRSISLAMPASCARIASLGEVLWEVAGEKEEKKSAKRVGRQTKC